VLKVEPVVRVPINDDKKVRNWCNIRSGNGFSVRLELFSLPSGPIMATSQMTLGPDMTSILRGLNTLTVGFAPIDILDITVYSGNEIYKLYSKE
jgi:hypothetical protein